MSIRSFVRRWGAQGAVVCCAFAAGVQVAAAEPQLAAFQTQADPVSGDVVVNGVLFEGSFGLAGSEIEALVLTCRDSLAALVELSPELQTRINAVLVTLAGGD